MYIFELIAQYFKGVKINRKNFDPLDNPQDGLVEDSDNCEHLFMPLDSSKEMFACKYCGLIVPKNNLENKKG
ncbi:hypothetical protein IJ541_01290 [bacterium]|nr:hypothetical protein [bacterium]